MNKVVKERVVLKVVKQSNVHATELKVSEAVSKSMRSNRSIGTLPEKTLARILWNAGYRGYRKNDKRISGKPDLYFPRLRIAVLLNGCFWHRCPYCKLPLPKSNTGYWSAKFEKNVERDRRQNKVRKASGIRTMVVWECRLKRSPWKVLSKFEKIMKEQEQIIEK